MYIFFPCRTCLYTTTTPPTHQEVSSFHTLLSSQHQHSCSHTHSWDVLFMHWPNCYFNKSHVYTCSSKVEQDVLSKKMKPKSNYLNGQVAVGLRGTSESSVAMRPWGSAPSGSPCVGNGPSSTRGPRPPRPSTPPLPGAQLIIHSSRTPPPPWALSRTRCRVAWQGTCTCRPCAPATPWWDPHTHCWPTHTPPSSPASGWVGNVDFFYSHSYLILFSKEALWYGMSAITIRTPTNYKTKYINHYEYKW